MSSPLPERQQRIKKKARKAKKDFSIFLTWILSREKKKIAKHHKPWIKALQDVAEGKNDELLIISPPGSAKSTVLVIFLAWIIGNNPTKHYGVVSFADRQAYDRCEAVGRIIKSHPVFHIVFPDVLPDPEQWARTQLRVMRPNLVDLHPTLMARGANSAIISYRFDGFVYDDPHDRKNASKPERRKEVIENHDEVLTTRMVKNAWEIDIVTRFSGDDLAGELIKRGYKTLRQKAMVGKNEDKSYWPEEVPYKKLKIKKDRNPAMFALQYQGDIKGGSSAVIKRLITYDEEVLPALESLVVAGGADTALKEKEKNDWNIIYVGGKDSQGNIWVLDRVKERCGVTELAHIFINLYEKWDYFNMWIEDAAAGTPAVDVLKTLSSEVPTTLMTPTQGGKRSRAHALAPFLHNGTVRFPANAEWFKEVEYELKHVGLTAHDDDPDALFQLVINLLKIPHWDLLNKKRPVIRLRMH